MADILTLIIAAVLFGAFVKYILFGGSNSQQQVGRPGAAPQRSQFLHSVPPEKIETVLAMFPAFPRSTIQQDLARTGSVEQTCENILSGVLVPPPAPVIPTAPTASVRAAGSSSVFPAHLATSTEPLVEPAKVWEQTPEDREKNLRARKEFMLQQARQ
ncbi:hypothetical protein DFJ77DRAFT_426019 [Powellomyces hirtus]|nr:hypothetical protein DFJ77DRAFT_426019 [Powellomyces hirtus]